MSLRVLFTNHRMAGRGGTQMWIRDVAGALVERGHRPVVWSPVLGESAAAVRAIGVPVIADLADLGEAPDLIHGHHLLETSAALAHFPGVPALFVCHGWLPWQEEPPRLPRIRRYLAVDRLRRERLVGEHGISPARVEVLPNFVDLRRIPPPRRRDAPLRRTLLLSNRTDSRDLVAAVREACRRMRLDPPVLVGAAEGNATDDPGRLVAEFDLVFARGRSALEAMASGAAVVLTDIEGCGPAVTSQRFDDLAELNFGVGALRLPLDGADLAATIAACEPDEALRVATLVRERCALAGAVDRLLKIYEQILREHRDDAGCLANAEEAPEGRAVARLLTEVSRRFETDGPPRLAALERELAQLQTTRTFRFRRWMLSRWRSWPRRHSPAVRP